MRNLEDYQQQYQNQPYERFQVYYRKQKINEILARFKHDTLLEVGCGLSSIFNDVDSYKKLYVIEPADDFYDKATQDLARLPAKENVVLIKDLVENTTGTLKEVQFDFILVSSLLHEMPEPGKFLRSIYDIASPQTVIHINVPNAKSFHRLLAVEMGLIKNEFQKSDSNVQFQQHSVFDIDSLGKLVSGQGFKIIESGSYSFKPFTHLQMEQMIQAGLMTNVMLDGFYKMEKYLPDLGSEIYVNVVKV